MRLPSDFHRYLGLKHNTREVRSLLRSAGILREPAMPMEGFEGGTEIEVSNPQDFLRNGIFGVEFGFEDEGAYLGAPVEEWGDSPMILTQIYLYAGHDPGGIYRGAFPADVVPGDDRATVRKKIDALGAPGRHHKRDTWVFKKHILTVNYAGEDGPFDFMVAIATPRAPEPSEEVLGKVTPVRALLASIGRSAFDPDVSRTLRPMVGGRPLQRETSRPAELNLREDFGLDVDFDSGRPDGDMVLSRLRFLGDQRFGSAIWPGDLPCGLTFQDGWSLMLVRVGRPPDAVIERDFDTWAYWDMDGYRLEVEYSTIMNDILSVSAFAPAD